MISTGILGNAIQGILSYKRINFHRYFIRPNVDFFFLFKMSYSFPDINTLGNRMTEWDTPSGRPEIQCWKL